MSQPQPPNQQRSSAAWPVEVLRPGDLVVVGQGVGEPTALLEALVQASPSLAEIEVFVGLSHSSVLSTPGADQLQLASFGAMGPLAQHTAAGTLSIIPCRFVDLPRVLPLRAPGRLVVLTQVSPPDDGGYHSVGLAVDYTYELVGQARAVVAEVNQQMPVTSGPRLPASAFDTVVPTSRPLPVIGKPAVRDVHRRIAEHVAALVPDGATIQLGIGALASVVSEALAARRDLRVHSTLVGDWLLTLAKAGALRDEPGSVMLSEAAGSTALYEYVTESGGLIKPVSVLNRPDVIGARDRFVAMNSALQVDLSGQVNAEEIESGYVGGVGGQPDFLRAAQRSAGGCSIVMLSATTARGQRSRVVDRLHNGTVTTPRSAVDFVVTEFGTADLRGKSIAERTEVLITVAAPQFRDLLRAEREMDEGDKR